MICDRCYKEIENPEEHGVWLCPMEDRRKAPAVVQDSIEGGIEIAHGLCNDDGSPKRYYSKTEIRDAARAKGFVAYHDVYVEDGNKRITDARARIDWLRSSEAQRARRDRVEARQEKALQRERETRR